MRPQLFRRAHFQSLKSNTSKDQTSCIRALELQRLRSSGLSGVFATDSVLSRLLRPAAVCVCSPLRPASLDLSLFCSAGSAAAPGTPWSPPRDEDLGCSSTRPNSPPSTSAQRAKKQIQSGDQVQIPGLISFKTSDEIKQRWKCSASTFYHPV